MFIIKISNLAKNGFSDSMLSTKVSGVTKYLLNVSSSVLLLTNLTSSTKNSDLPKMTFSKSIQLKMIKT